mgnify:CR=1 FL=1|jgi:hypothetical protein
MILIYQKLRFVYLKFNEKKGCAGSLTPPATAPFILIYFGITN